VCTRIWPPHTATAFARLTGIRPVGRWKQRQPVNLLDQRPRGPFVRIPRGSKGNQDLASCRCRPAPVRSPRDSTEHSCRADRRPENVHVDAERRSQVASIDSCPAFRRLAASLAKSLDLAEYSSTGGSRYRQPGNQRQRRQSADSPSLDASATWSASARVMRVPAGRGGRHSSRSSKTFTGTVCARAATGRATDVTMRWPRAVRKNCPTRSPRIVKIKATALAFATSKAVRTGARQLLRTGRMGGEAYSGLPRSSARGLSLVSDEGTWVRFFLSFR